MYIIDNGSRHTRALTRLLQPYNPEVIQYGDMSSKNIDTHQTIILSGGHNVPIVLWHNRQYRHELELIAHHTGLVVGICLGAELLAHYYGSPLRRLPTLFRGQTTLTPTPHDTHSLFSHKHRVYEAHRWTIPHVKTPLVPLASTRTGVEAFCHTNKPQYGLQFHPEMSSHTDNMLLNIIEQHAKEHKNNP